MGWVLFVSPVKAVKAMNKHKYIFRQSEIIVYVSYFFLFCYSFRFLNKNNTFLLLFVFFSFLFAFLRNNINLSFENFLLLLYGITYYYFYFYWRRSFDSTAFMTLCLGAPIMYFSGFNIISNSEDKEITYMNICKICMYGMFLFAFFSYLKNGVIYYYENGADIRAVPDLWTNTNWQATNFNGYCIFACIISLLEIIAPPKKTFHKNFLSLFLLVVSIYLSLVTAARTNIFICFLVLFLYVFLLVCKKKNWFVKKKNIFLFVSMLIIIIAAFPFLILTVDYWISFLPFDAFLERINNRSLSLKEDARWAMWYATIVEIPHHPWGNITNVKTSHNIFLDVARVSGILPMFFLFGFMFLVFKDCIKLFQCDVFTIQFRQKSFILLICLMLSFMIEPVLEAKPFIFNTFCMICGMQKACLEVQKIRKK